jgi:hypothetical protein
MKKLLFLLPVLLFACCGPRSQDLKPYADSGNFTVESISAVEGDSTKRLCTYILLSDIMYDNQDIQNVQSYNNPFRIVFTDTSGKYAVGDTLTLVPKLIPNPYGKTDI